MYDETLVGNWVKRLGRKRHLAQSIVNGQIITKCGARLRAKGWEHGPTVTARDINDIVCKRCL